MKVLGEVDVLLGIKNSKIDKNIELSQSHYIEKILNKLLQLNLMLHLMTLPFS